MPFYTVGDIAAELGVEVHRVQYVLKSRHVEPIRRAGNLRVFDSGQFALVRDELDRIDRRREVAAR